MEILLILLGIISIIVIVVMIKYFTDPKVRKAAKILNEYHEKENSGELLFNEKSGYIDTKEVYIEDDDTTSDDLEDILFDLEEYTENDDSIELPIRGINFRNLDKSKVGTFSGYIAPDKENKYDKYAIGVYSEDGTHFGFIEKNQKNLYKLIEAGEGYIDAILEVSTFIDEDTNEERFHGVVTIDKENLS